MAFRFRARVNRKHGTDRRTECSA